MNDLVNTEHATEASDADKAAAAPLASMPKFEESKTFPLSRPIKRMSGQLVEEITLRAPVALDLFEVGGLPTKTTWTEGEMSVEMDMDRVQQFISRLSQIEKPALYQMAARDVRRMFDWINGELNPSGN